ncbi:RdRP-domain-containing protein [Dendrothele bispora CBS 962.96]|uniref:RNA-dependent RNA polymerase n=1 Tax=Dendrothele bispora (strain CBS 962.96) TaxID=1314807 RepID=A0A4S8LIF8_DENBC|nr:RdRP-domain-containing protein [Dendrothele bispora CBS 962.96]
MDILMRYLPTTINEWDLTRRLALVLHSDPFLQPTEPDERFQKLNFRVSLTPSKAGGVRNDGTGVLTLPSQIIGYSFLDYVKEKPLKIEGKRVKFFKKGDRDGVPPKWITQTLQKAPYIDPGIEEEYSNKLLELQDAFRVDSVQFGVFFRRPPKAGEPLRSREYSIEWQRNYSETSTAWLRFEYAHKLIRIELGNPMTEQIGSTIAINFSSIQRIAIGYDGCPYICFDTLAPPLFEKKEFNRSLIGDDRLDYKKYKHRIGSLHPGHERVSSYAQKLRITLYNDTRCDIAEKFKRYCKIAELSDSIILDCRGRLFLHIEAAGHGFFTDKRLHILRTELKKMEWPVAFQLESLLHNCLLNTVEVENLIPRVKKLSGLNSPDYVADLLRTYGERLQSRPLTEHTTGCFERTLSAFDYSPISLSAGNFSCCHVTFAPTRLILEGPYAVQSNRIIRKYKGCEDHFIRVDFRDEDRLSYRWDRETDGSTFIQERVGRTLKEGFELAGRHFEFLAYSSSALREHAVWFMHPFKDPNTGDLVTAEGIRSSIGNFKGTQLLRQPSKYAARLSQAFTATDPSVKIRFDQWEEVPDITVKYKKDGWKETKLVFTDGVGTISESLANEIWEALDRNQGVKPSAYQIRFLGFKGVVSVDKELDKGNIRMRLRDSMKKFESHMQAEADIEIARAFERPNRSYLNRPLVTILEDRGVRKDSFLDLQRRAVAEVDILDDSIENCSAFLHAHNLGQNGFYLAGVLEDLGKLECDLTQKPLKTCIDNAFFKELRKVARMDVLREMKHQARIPIPDSYLLVGVADEGPVYREKGYDNVYILPEGHIYACVQENPNEEPIWLEGACTITRSPVVHPGDVQRVHAIGKPPKGMLCLFGHLKNVVVLPSVGRFSLSACLGGGDLDGDLYDVIMCPELLPTRNADPADYTSIGTHEIDRECDVNDICDFIVEYINSDVLGLLSDRLLVIADQSKEGIYDPACEILARLCSQAVDYPKQGIPVDLDKNPLPRPLIRPKPDWHAAEVVDPRHSDYYESSRALGLMYREIVLALPEQISQESAKISQIESPPKPMQDPISRVLQTKVQQLLFPYVEPNGQDRQIDRLYAKYVGELRYICATHTVSNTPGARLLETEVVIGTILSPCSQRRWRKDRISRMRLHVRELVKEIKRNFERDSSQEIKDREEYLYMLERAWFCWDYSRRKRTKDDQFEFGANSFGLIALGSVLHCLNELTRLAEVPV